VFDLLLFSYPVTMVSDSATADRNWHSTAWVIAIAHILPSIKASLLHWLHEIATSTQFNRYCSVTLDQIGFVPVAMMGVAAGAYLMP